jgi:hypothetical protein
MSCSVDWRGIGINVFPVFDPLRSDPRFIELLRKIGVEPHDRTGLNFIVFSCRNYSRHGKAWIAVSGGAKIPQV